MTEERLKHVAYVRVSNVDKKSIDGDAEIRLCNYTDVYYNERITGALDFMSATATPAQRAVFRLRPGDVLLTKDSETPDDIGVSALVAEDVPDLICGYHLAVVRPRPSRVVGGYVRWALASMLARQRMSAVATGVTRFGLRSGAIADLPIPVPPIATQRALADYLDRETAKIEAITAAKRRMVELLEEQMQGVVSGSTQARLGLDHSPARPSGWRLVPLRRCLDSADYGIGDASQPQGEYAVLGMTNIGAGEVLGPPGGFVSVVDKRLLLSPGDLLFNRTNSRELVGKVGLVKSVDRATTFASYLVRLRANRQIAIPDYLNYLLNAREVLGLARSMALPSIGQANLNPSRYSAIVLPIPPVDEQRRLVSYLDARASHTKAMKQTIDRQIALLAERRLALITAAVTGEIDVPEAA